MARRVFFSCHNQRDVWRVNQIRNIPNVTGTAAAGFQDASLWEEAKKKGDAEIKKMIDKALENTSVTVFFLTAARRLSVTNVLGTPPKCQKAFSKQRTHPPCPK